MWENTHPYRKLINCCLVLIVVGVSFILPCIPAVLAHFAHVLAALMHILAQFTAVFAQLLFCIFNSFFVMAFHSLFQILAVFPYFFAVSFDFLRILLNLGL